MHNTLVMHDVHILPETTELMIFYFGFSSINQFVLSVI